jgi:hypothetical protein
MPAQGEAEPSSYILPIDFSPCPPLHPGPICKPDESLDYRRSTSNKSVEV